MYRQQNDEFQGNHRQLPSAIAPGVPVHICVVGGGFGGLYTALRLRQFRDLTPSCCQITLIEKRDHFLFTPLLYEVVTGELQPWEIAPSYEQLLAGMHIRFCRAEVRDVDLQQRRVWLHDGRAIAYDYLVLAPGNETRLDRVPGAIDHAYPFRTLADTERLQERLQMLEASDRPSIRVAIAGAGPSGVEIACKLADLLGARGRIHLLNRGVDILDGFSRGSRVAAYRALVKRGVQVELETTLNAIAADTLTLTRRGVVDQLDTDLVIWTAGVQTLPWVRILACQHNSQGQVLTTATLQLMEYPEVFALGDLAEIWDAASHRVPATAQAAFQQAPHTAENLKALLRGRRSRPFRYLHLGEMLTLGTNAAVVSSFGVTLTGTLARILRRGVYIQRLPTWRHRRRVALRWLTNGIMRRLPRAGQRLLRPVCQRWLSGMPGYPHPKAVISKL